ncbi:MAG: TRAP transporter small permease, partial [Magnetococcales bacterium]|nr:TRAP transporter small permease [Magnetococcales bacterium]
GIHRLEDQTRRQIVLFGLVWGALFTAIIGTLGGHFVWAISQTDQTSADLELPMWWVYLCIPLGSYLMSWRFLQTAWQFFRCGVLPHYEHAHVEGIHDIADESTVYLQDNDMHPYDLKHHRIVEIMAEKEPRQP